jgi:hypothetical protein
MALRMRVSSLIRPKIVVREESTSSIDRASALKPLPRASVPIPDAGGKKLNSRLVAPICLGMNGSASRGRIESGELTLEPDKGSAARSGGID